MTFGEKLKQLRESKKLGVNQLALKSGVSASQISRFEKGERKEPTLETVEKLAVALGVSISYFSSEENKDADKRHYYDLTEKDERDIAKDLERMIADLSDGGALAFSKDESEIDQETRDLLIASLENSLRIAKIEAKKKFTPKKYRK